MAKDHGSSVKDDEQYEALRRDGASKEKAARIANAGRNTSIQGRRTTAVAATASAPATAPTP